jgi:hypothetical protein
MGTIALDWPMAELTAHAPDPARKVGDRGLALTAKRCRYIGFQNRTLAGLERASLAVPGTIVMRLVGAIIPRRVMVPRMIIFIIS